MPTIAQHKQAAENRRRAAENRTTDARDAMRRYIAAAEASGHEDYAAGNRLAADLRAAQDEQRQAEGALAEARRIAGEEAETDRLQQRTYSTGLPRPGHERGDRIASVHVGREERVYRRDLDPHGRQFLFDVARSHLYGDPQAQQQLQRHMAEERVERPGPWMQRAAGDATTSSFVGLVVPQYLTDMYAESVTPLRPFADNCNQHDLPASGMTINLALITTPAQVALTASELPPGNVAAQSLNDTLLTENVQTAAGQQTVSRQAIDRGTGIDEVTMQDLFRHFSTTLDATLITQAATGLSALGVVNTWTNGAPTPQLLWPLLFAANSQAEQALYGIAAPDLVIMHPRRFNWFVSSLGSTWPLISGRNMPGPQAGGVILTNEYGASVRAVLPNGLKIIADGSVPTNLGAGTNQDEIYLAASQECHLWTDPNAPLLIRAEQPKAPQLGVLFVVYGYFAYSFRRFASAVQKISGTGLIGPAGF